MLSYLNVRQVIGVVYCSPLGKRRNMRFLVLEEFPLLSFLQRYALSFYACVIVWCGEYWAKTEKRLLSEAGDTC